MDSQRRGLEAEDKVLEEMQRRGYRLVKRRWQTPVAEIDLLMASLSEYLVIEVKSLSEKGFMRNRVSGAQKRRLRQARLFVEDLVQADVRLVFAFVRPSGQIVLFNPGEDDLNSKV